MASPSTDERIALEVETGWGETERKAEDVAESCSESMASPSGDSSNTNTSPPTDANDRLVMDADQMHQLVNVAIEQARRATSKSPRRKTAKKSTVEGGIRTRPPRSPSIASRDEMVVASNSVDGHEAAGEPSPASHSKSENASKKGDNQSGRLSQTNSNDIDDLLSPTYDSYELHIPSQTSAVDSMVEDLKNLSMSSNSSDSIIRRVEEEIENARISATDPSDLSFQMTLSSTSKEERRGPSPTELATILDEHFADDEDIHNILNVDDFNDAVEAMGTIGREFATTPDDKYTLQVVESGSSKGSKRGKMLSSLGSGDDGGIQDEKKQADGDDIIPDISVAVFSSSTARAASFAVDTELGEADGIFSSSTARTASFADGTELGEVDGIDVQSGSNGMCNSSQAVASASSLTTPPATPSCVSPTTSHSPHQRTTTMQGMHNDNDEHMSLGMRHHFIEDKGEPSSQSNPASPESTEAVTSGLFLSQESEDHSNAQSENNTGLIGLRKEETPTNTAVDDLPESATREEEDIPDSATREDDRDEIPSNEVVDDRADSAPDEIGSDEAEATIGPDSPQPAVADEAEGKGDPNAPASDGHSFGVQSLGGIEFAAFDHVVAEISAAVGLPINTGAPENTDKLTPPSSRLRNESKYTPPAQRQTDAEESSGTWGTSSEEIDEVTLDSDDGSDVWENEPAGNPQFDEDSDASSEEIEEVTLESESTGEEDSANWSGDERVFGESDQHCRHHASEDSARIEGGAEGGEQTNTRPAGMGGKVAVSSRQMTPLSPDRAPARDEYLVDLSAPARMGFGRDAEGSPSSTFADVSGFGQEPFAAAPSEAYEDRSVAQASLPSVETSFIRGIEQQLPQVGTPGGMDVASSEVTDSSVGVGVLLGSYAGPTARSSEAVRGESIPSPGGSRNPNDTVKLSLELPTLDTGGSREIMFRHPYPVPKPLPKPRDADDIVRDNSVEAPVLDTIQAKPKTDLAHLLMAAKGPSLPRRSNALGALKVLTMDKKNRRTLVRTEGFLDALVYAANDDLSEEDEEIALDARTRAVTAILRVTEPKSTRGLVFGHPGLPECLAKVIREDRGDGRLQACSALALLARAPACKDGLVQIPGLVDVLAQVVKGRVNVDGPDFDLKTDCGSYHDERDDESVGKRIAQSSSSFSDASSVQSFDDDASSAVSSPRPTRTKSVYAESIRRQKEELQKEYLAQARLGACAALTHLSKHCAISDVLASNDVFVDSIVTVAREFDNIIHTRCLEIICNLTRFPANNNALARNPVLVDTLVANAKSKSHADRIWSLRAFQNMSADASSKVVLATSTILGLLSISAMRTDIEEQTASVCTLYNLSTEPGAVVPLTNTKNVVATLVHIAHNPESCPHVREKACDALATIGLWLQTLSGIGTVPEGVALVPLPSHATTGWLRWD